MNARLARQPAQRQHAAMPRAAMLFVSVMAACATSGAAPPPGGTAADAARALLAAPPHAWSERLAAACPHGEALVPPLLEGLQERPDAPGAPAAVALLGRVGGPAAKAALEAHVTERSPLATEAALALGEARSISSVAVLLACAADRRADATLRTAAACASIRCGERRAIAALVRGVLLAGTPDGQALEQELGLPEKPRWALERYMVQRALLLEAGDTFGLDTDLPWPALTAAADRITAWLERP